MIEGEIGHDGIADSILRALILINNLCNVQTEKKKKMYKGF